MKELKNIENMKKAIVFNDLYGWITRFDKKIDL